MIVLGNEKCVILVLVMDLYIGLFCFLWLSRCHEEACSFIVSVQQLCHATARIPRQCACTTLCALSLSLSLSLYIYIYIYIYIYDSLQFSGYVIFFKQWAGKRKKDSPSLLVRLFVCLRVAVRQLLDQLCLNLEWMFASGSHFASFLLKLSLVRGNFRMPRYKESLYCCSVILWGCLLLQSFLKLEGIKTPAVRNLRWF